MAAAAEVADMEMEGSWRKGVLKAKWKPQDWSSTPDAAHMRELRSLKSQLEIARSTCGPRSREAMRASNALKVARLRGLVARSGRL